MDQPDQTSANPAVDHPPHYNAHPGTCECGRGIECITVAEHFNFCLGNALKYIWRAAHKNGLEDLKKARWYIDREIARQEKLEKKGSVL